MTDAEKARDAEQEAEYQGVARSAPEGSPEKAEALRKYHFWMGEAKDARENIIFNEEVTFPAARDALAALVVGPAAKAYSAVRWGLGLMSVGSGMSRLNQASQQQGTQRTGNLIAGTAEVVAGGLMFTPEVVEAAPKVVDAAKALQQKATKFLDEFSVMPEGEVAGPGGVRMPVPEPVPAAPSSFAASSNGGSGKAPVATAPYKRPSGATTKAQRQSVQGKACVKCGDPTGKRIAGHKKALVEEHYETGTIDRERMRSMEAVQPECPTCSAKEGAEMSRYSREQKALLESAEDGKE